MTSARESHLLCTVPGCWGGQIWGPPRQMEGVWCCWVSLGSAWGLWMCGSCPHLPPSPFAKFSFELESVFPGKCNPYVSDSLTPHLQREGPGSPIWRCSASFFLEGESWLCQLEGSGALEFCMYLESRATKNSVCPVLPDHEWGHGQGGQGSFPVLLPDCSLGWSVRWLLLPGSQGQWGTSSCLPDLETNLLSKAELTFWKEGEVHIYPCTRTSEEKGQTESTVSGHGTCF